MPIWAFQAAGALAARRIAVPRFDPVLLERGHAVHFRCSAPGVEELRVDIMTRLRDLSDFAVLGEPLKRELEALRLAEARERGGLKTG